MSDIIDRALALKAEHGWPCVDYVCVTNYHTRKGIRSGKWEVYLGYHKDICEPVDVLASTYDTFEEADAVATEVEKHFPNVGAYYL